MSIRSNEHVGDFFIELLRRQSPVIVEEIIP
jgi:hypothetical protein